MGKRGPPPKTAAQLKLVGAPASRVRERERKEPAAPPGCPDRPDWIDARAAAEWDHLTDILGSVPGMLTEIDGHMLGLAAQTLADVKFLRSKLGDAFVVKGVRDREYVRSPLVLLLRSREQDLAKHLIEFGMSPAARARISVDGGVRDGEFEREYLDGSTG